YPAVCPERCVGASGLEAGRRPLEEPPGPASHPVTAPAEDDSVNPPGQNSLQQHLALFSVEKPADEEMHPADESYQESPDKTKESRLRTCERARVGGRTAPIRLPLGRPGRLSRPGRSRSGSTRRRRESTAGL